MGWKGSQNLSLLQARLANEKFGVIFKSTASISTRNTLCASLPPLSVGFEGVVYVCVVWEFGCTREGLT